MSGITPILDTLLHQVLGKRVDLPAPRDLNEAVKPMQPGTALQAPQSDSRLDPRSAAAVVLPSGHSAPGSLSPEPLQRGAPSPSSSTHLSDAAQDIARVLARFPNPPSVLRAALPLLEPGEPVPLPNQLSVRLQASVDSSGLFYESHVRRWYQGDMTREQLEREPQMMRSEKPEGTARPVAPERWSRSDPAPVSATHTAGMSAADDADHSIPEKLVGLVRHQLEMLATPVLRWEGDVWSGIFMALTIHLPEAATREWQSTQQHDEAPGDEGGEWHSELSLSVATIGEIGVSLRIFRERLALTLTVPDQDVQAQVTERGSGLEARLTGVGFTDVSVDVVVAGAGDA